MNPPLLVRYYYRDGWRPMLYVQRGRKYAHCVMRDNARGVVLRGVPLRDFEKSARPIESQASFHKPENAAATFLYIGEQHGISEKAYQSLQAIQGS
jgi:hypothetical protein